MQPSHTHSPPAPEPITIKAWVNNLDPRRGDTWYLNPISQHYHRPHNLLFLYPLRQHQTPFLCSHVLMTLADLGTYEYAYSSLMLYEEYTEPISQEDFQHELAVKQRSPRLITRGETMKLATLRNPSNKLWIATHHKGNEGLYFPHYLYKLQNEALIPSMQPDGSFLTNFITSYADTSFYRVVRRENFSPDFRKMITERYGMGITPEYIFGYLYSVMYHKPWRTKYFEFLKYDFPRIPFVSNRDLFFTMAEVGNELIGVHLMDEAYLEAQPVELPQRTDAPLSNTVDRVDYDPDRETLTLNASLFFSCLPPDVWGYYIGGYQVLKKYLSYRKKEELEVDHFANIIRVLKRTRTLEDYISSLPLLEECDKDRGRGHDPFEVKTRI